jgi:hypothetical protein
MIIKSIFIMTIFIISSLGFTQTVVSNNIKFGAKDSRGAYQEVRVKKFKVDTGYFTHYERLGIEHKKQIQIDSNIFPDRDTDIRHNYWGTRGEIYFQNGKIKTLSETPNGYLHLNKKQDYCFVTSAISFDSVDDINKDVLYNDGIVTLVSGRSYGVVQLQLNLAMKLNLMIFLNILVKK